LYETIINGKHERSAPQDKLFRSAGGFQLFFPQEGPKQAEQFQHTGHAYHQQDINPDFSGGGGIPGDEVCFLRGWRLAVVGWQLSVGGCRLSVGSCRLAVVGWQLSVGSCRLAVIGCQLPVTSYQLPVASCRLPVAVGHRIPQLPNFFYSWRLSVGGCRLRKKMNTCIKSYDSTKHPETSTLEFVLMPF
jgi:hypothetical protein